MIRNSGSILFRIFPGYLAVTLLAGALILLGGLAAVQFGLWLARLAFGLELVSGLQPVVADAAGFALISAMTALSQYYFTSLLALCHEGRIKLLAAAGSAALFSGMFFWRAAELSNLGAYVLSGLPITIAALIGAIAAILQKPEENPWPASCSRFLHF